MSISTGTSDFNNNTKDEGSSFSQTSSSLEPQTISFSSFKKMMKDEFFSNNNPTVNFKDEHYFCNQKDVIDGIAINPILPLDFWCTAHNEREQVELIEWWDRPFIRSEEQESKIYYVYILDGGAWDRPTTKHRTYSLDDALAIAKSI